MVHSPWIMIRDYLRASSPGSGGLVASEASLHGLQRPPPHCAPAWSSSVRVSLLSLCVARFPPLLRVKVLFGKIQGSLQSCVDVTQLGKVVSS